MSNPRETGRAEPRPIDPERALIIGLNDTYHEIWKLSGDVFHGDEEQKPALQDAITRQSHLVLDVLQLDNSLGRNSVSHDKSFVQLSWEPLRSDLPSPERRKYKFTDLEGALAQDLRMYEAGIKGYERDEREGDLGTAGAHFFELAKHKRMKRIGLAIQMHHWGALSRIRVERKRGKVALIVPSDNPHFEPMSIEVKLKDLKPEIRKLVPHPLSENKTVV